MNEYDEDFFDEKPAAKKEAAAEEVAQPNPEEGEKKRAFASPKAALCALFALLAAIVLGLGAAFFVVPAIFRTTVSVPFVIIGFAGGGILLALSIVMGFLCKKEAKEKGTEPKLGFVTSFFLSRLLSVFSIIGLFALFVFCLGAAIFNPDNYFSSLAGISSDILISLAMTVSFAAFPLFFLKLAYGALYELYGKGTLSDAGNRKGFTLDGETFAFFLGVWFGYFYLYGFGSYPREWLGLYVLGPDGVYITAEAAGMPVLPAFSYDPVMTLLAMFAIFTFLNFALRLVFFIRATKRNAAHGYVLLAKKRVPAFLMLIIGIAAMIAGFVMLSMAPAYPPEEYLLLGHTFEAVAAVIFWVGAALGVYAIVGVFPFLVLSFFKFMKTQPVIQPKEDPLAKETSRNALKRKKLAEEAEAAAEQGPEKEELDDILQRKLSLDKMKYRSIGSIFGAMLILALVSVGALSPSWRCASASATKIRSTALSSSR